MFQLNVILLTSAIFAFCESAAITEKISKKCAISDDVCLQGLFATVLQEISENGIPEMDIPKIDPFLVKDQEIDALGMIKIIMTEGEAKGLKNCNAGVLKADVENLRVSIDIVCDHFSIEGNYKIESSPTLLALIGGINIHGEGKGGVVVDKAHLTIDFAFEVKKLDDGELHLQIKPDETTFDFEVTGKAMISADNVFVGKQEISTVAVNIINENWEFIVNSFGRSIIDKALKLVYKQVQIILTNIPAKDLISDDLTSYVKS